MLKIKLDNIVFGFNSGDFALPIDLEGLQGFFNVSGQSNVVNFPRSDLSKTISIYQARRVRTISGTLKHLDTSQMINLRRQIAGLFREDKTFTVSQYLEDKRMELENIYTFQGRIVSADFIRLNAETYRYSITIESDSPNFSTLDQVVVNHTLVTEGLAFDSEFDLVFGQGLNTFEVVNTGNTLAYPVVKLKNQGSSWLLKNLTNNTIFGYSAGIGAGQEVVIDVKNNTADTLGNNKIEFVNNLESLILETGVNLFELQVASPNNSQVEFSFFPEFSVL